MVAVGLGSSLRNVNRFDESVSVLEDACRRFPDHQALPVFLAFSLWIGNHFIAADHGARSRSNVLKLAMGRLEA